MSRVRFPVPLGPRTGLPSWANRAWGGLSRFAVALKEEQEPPINGKEKTRVKGEKINKIHKFK